MARRAANWKSIWNSEWLVNSFFSPSRKETMNNIKANEWAEVKENKNLQLLEYTSLIQVRCLLWWHLLTPETHQLKVINKSLVGINYPFVSSFINSKKKKKIIIINRFLINGEEGRAKRIVSMRKGPRNNDKPDTFYYSKKKKKKTTVNSRLSGLIMGRGGTDNPNYNYFFLRQTIILTCLMLIIIKKICDFGLFAGIF